GFASERKDNRAHPFHPFKRASGLSGLYESRVVRRGVADDLARPRDRDATGAAFNPRVEWTGADRAFVSETDDEARFLHGTHHGGWNVAALQVDHTGVRECTRLGRASSRTESRRRSCRHRGGSFVVRASATEKGTQAAVSTTTIVFARPESAESRSAAPPDSLRPPHGCRAA